jgi:signal transduction histidine kinase
MADGHSNLRAERVEALLRILKRSATSSERGFLAYGLEEIERLTGIKSSFLHLVNDDQETLELATWSKGALRHCTADFAQHYPISRAGIWASCVRARQPVVINDYAATAGRKGVPEGHLTLVRLVSVPVIEGDKVRMIFGVGNKETDYTADDVDALQKIGNDLWRIAHNARLAGVLPASWNRFRTLLDTKRFHTIFNALGEAVFLCDLHGHVLDVNQAGVQMYGYERKELAVVGIEDLGIALPPPHEPTPPGKSEHHVRRRNGEAFWVETGLSRVMIGGKEHLLAVISDISERKQMQDAATAHVQALTALYRKLESANAQLLQSEKLASIGQLAAGVAHEINNPVGFVLSNVGSLERYLKDLLTLLDAYEQAEPALDAATREGLQTLRQALDIGFLREDAAALLGETLQGIHRVRKIVKDLMDFSRAGSDDDWQWLDVHAGLDSTLNIAWNELKYKAEVKKDYGALPHIYGLPAQLNQVFMNLLVNAAHAIETRGVVTIRTGREGDEVWIEVEDTGCGIGPDHLNRIFDPFFTTKDIGKGTGLGLSVSYSIVQKHRGRIEVRSEVGKGTAFRVWLPVNGGGTAGETGTESPVSPVS